MGSLPQDEKDLEIEPPQRSKNGYRSSGAPKITFVDNIRRDVDLQATNEIRVLNAHER